MPSRTARLSKKGCGDATPECRAQRDVAVHPRPAPPPPLLAAPRLSTTALGYLEIRWVVSETAASPWSYLPRGGRTTVSGAAGKPPGKAPRPFSGHRNGRTCCLIGQQQREPPGFLGSLPPFILGCIESPPQIPDLVGKLRAFAVPFLRHGGKQFTQLRNFGL